VSGKMMKRFVVASAIAACTFGAGYRAGAQATSQPAAPKPIAVINGHEINNERFDQLLMQVCGLRVFEEVLNWTIVQQACNQAGFQTDGDDFNKLVQAEYQHVLDTFGANGISEEDRPKFLQAILQRQGVSPVEFQMTMQQQAGLRALSKGHVDVTDEEVKQQFDSDYGDVAEARIITIRDTSPKDAFVTASKVREQIEKEKKDPSDVARDLKLPIQAVKIPRNAEGAKEFRDTAFQLKPGQLSASVLQNGMNFLIFLDKIDPAQPNVKFDSVKDKVRQEVSNAKQDAWMRNQLNYLRSQARVDVNDPVLAQQFAAVAAQMRAAQAAASQPATAPAK
jgi:hypothetical protein